MEVVAHAFNSSTLEAEAGGSLSSRWPGLQSKFLDSQSYAEKSCLEHLLPPKVAAFLSPLDLGHYTGGTLMKVRPCGNSACERLRIGQL